MTLACEDAFSKPVEVVVTVADVSDDDHVGNSFFADLEAEVWS